MTTSTEASGTLLSEAHAALAAAKAAGAEDVVAAISTGRSTEFAWRDGSLERVEESGSRALSLGLYVDGRYSSHNTCDLRPEAVKPFIEQAVALTRAIQPDPHRRLPDPSLYEGRVADSFELLDGSLDSVDRETCVRWLTAMDEAAHADERVISSTSQISVSRSAMARVTSNGFEGTHEGGGVSAFTEVTVQGAGDKRPESYAWASARHRDDMPAPEALGREALERALARLGSAKAASCRTHLVLDREAVGTLLRPMLGALGGAAIQQGRSFLKDRLGEQVVSPLLTLTDNPHVVRGLATRTFDGEGIATLARPIFDAGKLSTYFIDSYYANKLGVAPTTGSTSNVEFTLGTKDRDALIADVGTGIYLTGWAGGNSDGTNGDFSYGIRGHRIEDGKIGAPVSEMNVSGSFLELWSRLVAVGNDPFVYSGLRSPTLVFEDVAFSGS